MSATPSTDWSAVSGPIARRWWSSRRLPVAVVTGAAALVCGALTLDVARVRLLGLPPARWRGGAVDWLSTHGAGDLPVVLGGAGAALAGLVLVVLAVTPGQRRLLPLSPPVDQPVFALDRSAVSALVEEAVSDVAGIGRVRVRHLAPLHGPVLDQRPRRLPPPRTDRAARPPRAL
ncbi:hypothetical protein DLE01_13325, partial [Streptomyces sp. FT05W]